MSINVRLEGATSSSDDNSQGGLCLFDRRAQKHHPSLFAGNAPTNNTIDRLINDDLCCLTPLQFAFYYKN